MMKITTSCLLKRNAKFVVGIDLETSKVSVISSSCTENPTPGKITFINGSNQMVRVHLSPTLTWGHFERRTNETLRSDPRRRIGSIIEFR